MFLDRQVGWVWLQVVCRWVAPAEWPPGRPRARLDRWLRSASRRY